MNQRTALATAAALTAFILIVIGGLSAYLMQPQIGAAQTQTQVDASAAQAAGIDPATVQALLDERDAAYTQQLQQAEQQLHEANTRLQQAYNQLQKQGNAPLASQVEQSKPASAAPAYPVSADNALATAQNAAPGAKLLRGAELVDFQGAVAYEVLMDAGPVYVDANSGQVLYNGAQAPVPSQAIQVTGSGGDDHGSDGHDTDDHEGEGSDD